MDKKSKVFISIFLLLFIISVGATYYKYVVLGDFEVYLPEEEEVEDEIAEEEEFGEIIEETP